YPDDIDVLLVGPSGQTVMLMSDAGGESGATGISSVTITFDDSAASAIPDESIITSGTYKPTNYADTHHGESVNDSFTASAPSAPYGTTLSVFNGTNPNGVWRL